jgi:hypothetical protein
MIDALTAARVAQHRTRNQPTVGMRFTRPQRLFLQDDFPIACWRDGNQLGKSTALAVWAHDCARGVNRFFRTARPPVRIVVMGTSHEQMEPLYEKMWFYAAKDELDPRCGYDPGRAITGKPPRLVYVRGPGKGSVIVFGTYKQGASRVAGSTVDGFLLDEPCPETIFGEVRPRVLRRRGWI